ncbi:Lon protease [Dirofilaria immitis]
MGIRWKIFKNLWQRMVILFPATCITASSMSALLNAHNVFVQLVASHLGLTISIFEAYNENLEYLQARDVTYCMNFHMHTLLSACTVKKRIDYCTSSIVSLISSLFCIMHFYP